MVWSHKEAADRMGMPEHEILAVAEVGDYHVVTTHDGQKTLVTAEGDTAPVDDDVDAAAAEASGTAGPTEASPADIQPTDPGERPAELQVPDGTAEQVLEWVGQDPARARAALEAEQARSKPRTTLVGQLDKLAQPPA